MVLFFGCDVLIMVLLLCLVVCIGVMVLFVFVEWLLCGVGFCIYLLLVLVGFDDVDLVVVCVVFNCGVEVCVEWVFM